MAIESTINYECCLAFLMGVPVGYLLNRAPRILSRVEFMIAVGVISAAIIILLDLLAVILIDGAGYLQDINWYMTAQYAAQDLLAGLIIGSIIWKNRGRPEPPKIVT